MDSLGWDGIRKNGIGQDRGEPIPFCPVQWDNINSLKAPLYIHNPIYNLKPTNHFVEIIARAMILACIGGF